MSIHIYVLAQVFRLLLDLLVTHRLSDDQKDLEILLLRHQLRILQRKLPGSRVPSISVWEKGILAILAAQLRGCAERTGRTLDEAVLLFKPDTVLRWHRELVRRKWTFLQAKRTGRRPAVATELEALIVRLAQENPGWGYSKIQGELQKLGYSVSGSVRTQDTTMKIGQNASGFTLVRRSKIGYLKPCVLSSDTSRSCSCKDRRHCSNCSNSRS